MKVRKERAIVAAAAVGLLLLLLLLILLTGEDEAAESDSDDVIDLLDQSDELVLLDGMPEDTIVWLHDQEPVSLHADDPDNLGSNTSNWIQQGLLEGLFGVDKSLSYYPELLESEPTVVEDDGEFTVNYTMRSDIQWSDGEPIDSSDVQYTFDIITDGCDEESDGTAVDSGEGCFYKKNSIRGYSLVSNFEVQSATEFSLTFVTTFADWRSLFPIVFAEHAYGSGALEVNEELNNFETGDLPVSGPFALSSWNRGVDLTLMPNENYHGSNSPDLENETGIPQHSIQLKFLPNIKSLNANLEAGNGHFVMTDVSTTFLEVESSAIERSAIGSSIWEHIGMNLANDHLENVVVREAVAAAIDKPQLIADLYAPLFGDNLPGEGLGNSFWMPNQAGYVNNQTLYANANQDLVDTNMGEAGYSLNDDGVWTHPEKGVAEFQVATISGDSFRLAQQDLVISQLEAAGFSATENNFGGGDFYRISQSATGPFASKENWDLAIFSWAGGPWPGGQIGTYGGKSSANNVNNIYGYSNTDYDSDAEDCAAQLDQAEVDSCFAEIDTYATTVTADTGLFIIPISQKPSFFAWNSDLIEIGEAIDFPTAGPLVNASDFSLVS